MRSLNLEETFRRSLISVRDRRSEKQYQIHCDKLPSGELNA